MTFGRSPSLRPLPVRSRLTEINSSPFVRPNHPSKIATLLAPKLAAPTSQQSDIAEAPASDFTWPKRYNRPPLNARSSLQVGILALRRAPARRDKTKMRHYSEGFTVLFAMNLW
jgi:hypothetical protein